MAPFIIRMKVLFQLLWKKKVDWDTELDEDLTAQHVQWRNELSILKNITLPRCYFSPAVSTSVQLHGFSDASEIAYAAAVYIRATYEDDTITSRLVVAKTWVAPLNTVSIPRLELCGAEMLSDLLATTKHTLNVSDSDVYAWCDSTVALAWLRGCPSDYKTFVANRVASAARNIPQSVWLHVSTEDNPADCASRGLSAQELQNHHLWWGGPPWLKQEPIGIPPQPGAAEIARHQTEEAKPVAIHVTSAVPNAGWENKFNNYSMLLHTTAYIFRFCANLKAATQGQPLQKDKNLTVAETEAAEVFQFKQAQARTYRKKIETTVCSQPSPHGKGIHPQIGSPFSQSERATSSGRQTEQIRTVVSAETPSHPRLCDQVIFSTSLCYARPLWAYSLISPYRSTDLCARG